MDLGYHGPTLGKEFDLQFGSLSKELFVYNSTSQLRKLSLRKVKKIIQTTQFQRPVRRKAEVAVVALSLCLCHCPTFQATGPGSGVLELL